MGGLMGFDDVGLFQQMPDPWSNPWADPRIDLPNVYRQALFDRLLGLLPDPALSFPPQCGHRRSAVQYYDADFNRTHTEPFRPAVRPQLDREGWSAWLTFKQDRRLHPWMSWTLLATAGVILRCWLFDEERRCYVEQARTALTRYTQDFFASSTYSLDAGMPVTNNGGGSNGVQFMWTAAGSASSSEGGRNGPPVRYRNGSPRSR